MEAQKHPNTYRHYWNLHLLEPWIQGSPWSCMALTWNRSSKRMSTWMLVQKYWNRISNGLIQSAKLCTLLFRLLKLEDAQRAGLIVVWKLLMWTAYRPVLACFFCIVSASHQYCSSGGVLLDKCLAFFHILNTFDAGYLQLSRPPAREAGR